MKHAVWMALCLGCSGAPPAADGGPGHDGGDADADGGSAAGSVCGGGTQACAGCCLGAVCVLAQFCPNAVDAGVDGGADAGRDAGGGPPPMTCDLGGAGGAHVFEDAGLPACTGLRNVGETCLFEADGGDFRGCFETDVTVVEVAGVARGGCPWGGVAAGSGSIRMVLEAADLRRWTVVYGVEKMPADLIRPGETLRFRANGARTGVLPWFTQNQAFSLADDAGVRAFGATLAQAVTPQSVVPNLRLSLGAPRCQNPAGLVCQVRRFALDVVYEGQFVPIAPGETAVVGPWTLAVDALEQLAGGSCEGYDATRIAGFRN